MLAPAGERAAIFLGDRPEEAAEILRRINASSLGQLLRRIEEKSGKFDQAAHLLAKALAERNRLAHSFFRQHNFRMNSEAGRALMLADLESIHASLLAAYKAALAVSGIDLDAVAGFALPTRHLKLE